MTTTVRGRPRDQAIDGAVLDATRELLVEVGYTRLSMDAVAVRAGISKPTLYRRYASRGALVAEAALGGVPRVEPVDTGDLESDFLAIYRWGLSHVTTPAGRAAVAGLLAEGMDSPELGELIRARFIEPAFARIAVLLAQAQQRGEIREDVDLHLVLEACTGTMLARITMLDRPVDDAFSAELVHLLFAGLTPRQATAPAKRR